MGLFSSLNPINLLGGNGGSSSYSSGGILNKEQANLSTSTSATSAASDSSIATGASSTVNVLDSGAVGKSIDLAGDVASEAIKNTAEILDFYQKQNRDSLNTLAQFATESQKEGVQQLTENVFKYGLWGLGALGATFVLTMLVSTRKKAA